MPQPKIDAFFKPSNLKSKANDSPPISGRIESWEVEEERKDHDTRLTYKRSHPSPDLKSEDEVQLETEEDEIRSDRLVKLSARSGSVGKIMNKKRSYAQYHLEFGQSDFLLHTCSVCGLMYARGDEGDEKVHKSFHRDFYEGIIFKGWRNERVVSTPNCNGDRIVLVLDGDPSSQKNKVRLVTKVMEKDLGFSDGMLVHNLCKVYLYILSHRIVGCLVAEPIKTAHRVISKSPSSESFDKCTKSGASKAEVADADSKRPPILQFGSFNFHREVIKKDPLTNSLKADEWDSGAILCKEDSVPAFCGIRAIWVVPSQRRKGIASRLLDAARSSFCTEEQLLQPSQCAFSPPTSAGKALASRYSRTKTFLVYRADDTYKS